LRGDFRATERALSELKKAKRAVAVAFKETGMHQMAEQLSDPGKFERFLRIARAADGCVASTEHAAQILRMAGSKPVAFIPTPCPIEDENWNWRAEHRSGIFVGTREFDVPSRNHLAALLAARKVSDDTREPVTVFNLDRRRGARLIAQIGFSKVRVHEQRASYRAYLGEVARHKIVFQLDRSRVPGQVAGDALLCRSVCIGGDGATETIAFPETCGTKRSADELINIAQRLLRNDDERRAIAARGTEIAMEKLSFTIGRENLARFFKTL
jgi:putative intracellular protease/amidase